MSCLRSGIGKRRRDYRSQRSGTYLLSTFDFIMKSLTEHLLGGFLVLVLVLDSLFDFFRVVLLYRHKHTVVDEVGDVLAGVHFGFCLSVCRRERFFLLRLLSLTMLE